MNISVYEKLFHDNKVGYKTMYSMIPFLFLKCFIEKNKDRSKVVRIITRVRL